MQQLTLDMTRSENLKDAGMHQVLEHEETMTPGWTADTIDDLRKFCTELKKTDDHTFCLEEFRVTRRSEQQPANPNCWGSIPQIAAKRGIIRFTGRYRNSGLLSAHARSVKIWQAL